MKKPEQQSWGQQMDFYVDESVRIGIRVAERTGDTRLLDPMLRLLTAREMLISAHADILKLVLEHEDKPNK